jgi:hypothetical protein
MDRIMNIIEQLQENHNNNQTYAMSVFNELSPEFIKLARIVHADIVQLPTPQGCRIVTKSLLICYDRLVESNLP